MGDSRILEYDFDYTFNPDWTPANCGISPWFLFEKPQHDPNDTSWATVLSYRWEKLAFVRSQLRGVNREATLKAIITKVWEGAASDRERYERLVLFVQKMMLHPPVEQPLERDAMQKFRHECSPPITQAPPYPDDLEVPWMVRAYEESQSCGWDHLGVWCNPIGRALTGDWGMAGVPWDALELLMLHEGRCGHQAAVTVQLAQAGGWRARLLQLNHHRAAEVMVDGKWALADADLWEEGFIGTTDTADIASVEWCLDHLDYVEDNWPIKSIVPGGYAYVLTLTD